MWWGEEAWRKFRSLKLLWHSLRLVQSHHRTQNPQILTTKWGAECYYLVAVWAWRVRGPGDGLHVAVGGAGHVAGVGPRHEVVGSRGSGALDPALADLLTRWKRRSEVTWLECDTCDTHRPGTPSPRWGRRWRTSRSTSSASGRSPASARAHPRLSAGCCRWWRLKNFQNLNIWVRPLSPNFMKINLSSLKLTKI